jgi:hypothetical protein
MVWFIVRSLYYTIYDIKHMLCLILISLRCDFFVSYFYQTDVVFDLDITSVWFFCTVFLLYLVWDRTHSVLDTLYDIKHILCLILTSLRCDFLFRLYTIPRVRSNTFCAWFQFISHCTFVLLKILTFQTHDVFGAEFIPVIVIRTAFSYLYRIYSYI